MNPKDDRRERRLPLDLIRSAHRIMGEPMDLRKEGEFTSIVNRQEVMANRVCVLPKYRIAWATDRAADMQAMLGLATADCMRDTVTVMYPGGGGIYDWQRHQYLRQCFTAVFVTLQNRVYDTHYDVMRFVGNPEWTYWLRSLEEVGTCVSRPLTDKTRPEKREQRKPKRQRVSDRAKVKMATPKRRKAPIDTIPESEAEKTDEKTPEAIPQAPRSPPLRCRVLRIAREPRADVQLPASPEPSVSPSSPATPVQEVRAAFRVICVQCGRHICGIVGADLSQIQRHTCVQIETCRACKAVVCVAGGLFENGVR